MLGISPVYGQEYIVLGKLTSTLGSDYKVLPDISTGDFVVEAWLNANDFGPPTNTYSLIGHDGDMTTDRGVGIGNQLTAADPNAEVIRVSPTSSTLMIKLSAVIMTHAKIVITATDVVSDNSPWSSNAWVIYPDARQTQLAHLDVDVSKAPVADITGLATSTEIAGLNNIAATDIVSNGPINTLAGAVTNVDLVDTCTANTDMRGTDGANTVTPPSAGVISNAVWEETTANHVTTGTAGLAITQSNGLTAQQIWEYATRTLTSASAGGATAQEVWEYATRTLTSGGGDATAANQATIISYLDTEIAAIKAVTDNLPDAGALSSIAKESTVAALNNVYVADLLAGTIEGSLTVQQVLKIMLAVLAGQTTGGGTTTVALKDPSGVNTRVTATVDSNGNRSNVTLTP